MGVLSIALAGAVAAAALMPSPGWADGLDGRRFEGVFIERGKTSGESDTLIFKDGRFRSVACDRYGYVEVPYKSVVAGDAVQFEAESASPKHGRLVWKGVVRGGKLDATATWVRTGKAPVENWIVAAERN